MTYRQFERLPAHQYGLRFNRKTQQLRAELNLPEPANDFTSDPTGSSRMLIAAFGLGALFWMLLGWACT